MLAHEHRCALPRPVAAASRFRFVGIGIANHYFLDSAAGVVVVLTALTAIRLFNRKER